jgi:hypothetical protein
MDDGIRPGGGWVRTSKLILSKVQVYVGIIWLVIPALIIDGLLLTNPSG